MNSQPENNQPIPTQESGLVKTLGQCLTFAPLLFEQFTGQKVPQMGGTMAEMQMTLINIQTNLQIVIGNQQALSQRLSQLENNAVQQFTNLAQQFHSLRLTHTREKKEIAYNNPDPNPNNY